MCIQYYIHTIYIYIYIYTRTYTYTCFNSIEVRGQSSRQVERFEPTVPQSAVPSPPLKEAANMGIFGCEYAAASLEL